jgi:hypothetical protein
MSDQPAVMAKTLQSHIGGGGGTKPWQSQIGGVGGKPQQSQTSSEGDFRELDPAWVAREQKDTKQKTYREIQEELQNSHSNQIITYRFVCKIPRIIIVYI